MMGANENDDVYTKAFATYSGSFDLAEKKDDCAVPEMAKDSKSGL